MRTDGISAWQAYDGAVNGERFLQFLETKLCPTLRPGDVIVLDNVRFHHMHAAERLRTLHLRKALQGLAARGHPFWVSLSAAAQAQSPSAAANASR